MTWKKLEFSLYKFQNLEFSLHSSKSKNLIFMVS